MGVDINGWVEVQWDIELSDWTGIVRVENTVTRSYDMFGLLFGVMNMTGFAPIALNRGWPENPSDEIRAIMDAPDQRWPTWILWTEIKAIDWDETALDHRPHMYKRQPDGTLKPHDFFKGRVQPPNNTPLSEGLTWEGDRDTVYRIERIKKRLIRDGAEGWTLLFDLMAVLANHYEDDNVRLVVWFDR